MVNDLTCGYAIFSLFLNDCVLHCKPSNSLYRHYSSSHTFFFFPSLKFVPFSLFIYPHLHSSIFFNKVFEWCKIKRKMEWVKRESISCHTIWTIYSSLATLYRIYTYIGLYIYTHPRNYYSKTFSCTTFFSPFGLSFQTSILLQN